MDENTWRLAQLLIWVIGAQTAFLTTILSALWCKSNKIEEKIDSIDRRLSHLEGAFFMKEHISMMTEDKKYKKAG